MSYESPFDVRVERKLTPEMQGVADAREKVRRLEAKVESAKGELKAVKGEWEAAVQELNEAIDEAVNAQRQPSLFPAGADAGADAPEPPPPAEPAVSPAGVTSTPDTPDERVELVLGKTLIGVSEADLNRASIVGKVSPSYGDRAEPQVLERVRPVSIGGDGDDPKEKIAWSLLPVYPAAEFARLHPDAEARPRDGESTYAGARVKFRKKGKEYVFEDDDKETAEAPAAEAPAEPKWRALAVSEALDGHARVFDAFETHGVTTLGQLADRLKAGETFGLRLTDVEDLKEEVELKSADDAVPVTFAGEVPKEPEDEKEVDRSLFPEDLTGDVEHRLEQRRAGGLTSPAGKTKAGKIADFRDRQRAGKATPAWGKWSEFELTLADGSVVKVLYNPGRLDRADAGDDDHFEFRGQAISPSGYRSHFLHHGGRRPKQPLVKWATEFAEQLAAELKVEQAKKSRKRAVTPAKVVDAPDLPKPKRQRKAKAKKS